MKILDNIKQKIDKEKLRKKEQRQYYTPAQESPRFRIIGKLFSMIGKNIKLVTRSKATTLLFLFGPLLITLIVTLAFNTTTLYDLNIATYNPSPSSVSQDILTLLKDKQYNVVELSSEQDCTDAIRFSDFQACIIFPADLAIQNNAKNTIAILVDNSRLNIANLIAGQISSKISNQSTELSEGLVSNLLATIDKSKGDAQSVHDTLIQTENKQDIILTDISTIGGNLNSVDFGAGSYDVNSIYIELDNVSTQNNLSSSTFSSIRDMLANFEAAYKITVTNLNTAEDVVLKNSQNLLGLAPTIEQGKSELQTTQAQLNTIITTIDAIPVTDVKTIVSPLQTSIQPITSRNSYLFYLLPTILVLVIMLLAMLLSSSNIISEKTSQAHFRNFITPTNILLFTLGEYLSTLLIVGIQVGIILGVLFVFFPEFGWLTFALAAGVLILIGTLFIFLGMFIGYLLNTKQSVTIASLSFSLVFLFFSNTLLPLETLSRYTRDLVMWNPFIIGETMLKRLFLFASPTNELAFGVYALVAWCVLALLLAIFANVLLRYRETRPA